MASNGTVIVLSDDSDEGEKGPDTTLSPLTNIKDALKDRPSFKAPKHSRRSSARKTKPSSQPTLNAFFKIRGVREAPPEQPAFLSQHVSRLDSSSNDALQSVNIGSCSLDDIFSEKDSVDAAPSLLTSLQIKRDGGSLISSPLPEPKKMKAEDLLQQFAPRPKEGKIESYQKKIISPMSPVQMKPLPSKPLVHTEEKAIPDGLSDSSDQNTLQFELKPRANSIVLKKRIKQKNELMPELTSTQISTVNSSTPHKSRHRNTTHEFDQTISPLKLYTDTTLNEKQPRLSESLKLFESSDWTNLSDMELDESRLIEESLNSDYGRHTIVLVDDSGFQKLLTLKTMDGETRYCVLSGFWSELEVKSGDIVNLIGELPDLSQPVLIDMKSDNMIVVNPDYLVSGSVIASATQCVRRSVLGYRYKGTDAANKYTLLGTILHEVFQTALQQENHTETSLRKITEDRSQTPDMAHLMYSIKMPDKELKQNMDEYIKPILQFLKDHVATDGTRPKKDGVSIVGIEDIEETVWSPRFGMKGKIDVTVNISRVSNTASSLTTEIVPLELKTGRPSYSAEHKGQVSMYSMMLSEQQNGKYSQQELKDGVLVYLKDGSMQPVANSKQAIAGLVQLRNRISDGLLKGVTEVKSDSQARSEYTVERLPEPIDSSRTCKMCPYLLTCSLQHRYFDKRRLEQDHSLRPLIEESLIHLNDVEIEYFIKWSQLLLIEASSEAKWKIIRDIWCKPLAVRVKSGHCISDVTINEIRTIDIEHYEHVCSFTQELGLSDIYISEGDNLLISDQIEKTRIAQTIAHCSHMSSGRISFTADRRLKMSGRYYADKYDMYSNDSTGMTNLSILMENRPESQRIRQLVIHKTTPSFYNDTEPVDENILADLNSKQRTAVEQALLAKDYLIIKGFPGTGKTSTIVSLVRALRFQGLSVLVTSYTNSAVDTVLLKLKSLNEEFVRIGRTSRIHPDLTERCHQVLTSDLKTEAEIEAFYSSHHLYGSTCLSLKSHALFRRRKFDVCIIDEASQIMQPVSLSALFQADRFILVGDNKQLPPLVRHPYTKINGMDETLMDLLSSAHPQACIELVEQYRMNSQITSIANKLVYGGKLCCANQIIADSTIPSIYIPTVEPAWLTAALNSDLDRSVIWLNTENDALKKSSICSEYEGKIVCQLCGMFGRCVLSLDVGVITPYQAQAQYIKRLRSEGRIESNVEINTVDQYQGRDKSVIIISFVKTNDRKDSGESNMKDEGILSDMRRLNVAITRAKHKLILIGHIPSLKRYSTISQLLNCIPPNNIFTTDIR